MGKVKNLAGQPTKANKINLKQVKKLALAGFTDRQIADFFDINEVSLANYKKKYPKFFKSLIDWKKEADIKVEQSLYKRAIGYEYDEVTYEKSKIGGLGAKIEGGEIESLKHCDTYKTKVITKQVAPDVLAQIFWLKNRQPAVWKDKTDIEHTLPDSVIEKFSNVPVNELLAKVNALIGKPHAQ